MFIVIIHFSGILVHIKPETRFFHKEQFLEDVSEHDRVFYEKVAKIFLKMLAEE